MTLSGIKKINIFQINDITTGLIYNDRSNQGPITFNQFDWSTMALKDMQLRRSVQMKSFPICTPFMDIDNKLKLLFTLEESYLNTFEVREQVDYITRFNAERTPKQLYRSSEKFFSQFVAANNKTELFLYGGQVNDEILDGIYKYSQVTKLWMKVGTMIFPRASHVVIPVQGLSCP
jgi:hypothetical protein